MFASLVLVLAQAQIAPLMGFTTAHSVGQRALEAEFDRGLEKSDLPIWLKKLSAIPHHVGSPYGLQNAEYVRGLFESWGFDAKIERFEVLFPEPKTRLLEMGDFKAKLAEPQLSEDPTSAAPGGLPSYNAYSCDGDVTGKLVYVNYGIPKDYETLEQNGVSVKGRIVIARYGGSWRGIKPKVAAEHGAIGCLIYSDPRDDGYFQGDVYPKGPFRNDKGVQRGSVADMPLYPGDPSTPGYGSVPGVKRLDRKDVKTITKIPTLPISYGDALPLLKSLQGPVAPSEWRGGIPVTYKLGPGDQDVHLKVEFDWKIVEARDIIAKLPGSERPDEWVIRGNHHDAWVMGAQDPLSGAIALLEEAKGVGKLAAAGWKPKRTIVYCLWDGEEPGLLGSTEWVETHAEELSRKAVAYINSDTNGRGFFGAGGSHGLEKFVNEVSRDVIDPETKMTLAQRNKARQLTGTPASGHAEIRGQVDSPIGALGSGSDYSSFLQHAGIASLDLGFGGEDPGGIYHSTYDSFDWYSRFGDPKWEYGIALAQTAGRMMLRLANADVLPFEFTRLASTIGGYTEELPKLLDTMRVETEETNKLIDDGSLKAASDPTKPFFAPKKKDAVPFLNFAPLQNAVAKLKLAAAKYEASKASSSSSLDHILMSVERSMLGEGLPRRPWYRHEVYAPGFYTGYGVKTIPGVREAIEQRDWKEAQEQIALAAEALGRLSSTIEAAVNAAK